MAAVATVTSCVHVVYLRATLALAITVVVHGQGIIFPDNNSNSEINDSCVLPSGATGICKLINDCPAARQNVATQHPKICGFQGRIAIVCCTQLIQDSKLKVVDISPPTTNFECGRAYGQIAIEPQVLQTEPSPPVESKKKGCPPILDPFVHYSTNPVEAILNSWPWMALVGEDRAGSRVWFCGGVLLNRHWVITAAHCTNRFNATWVRLGEHDVRHDDEGVQVEDVGVADVIFHPGYQLPEKYHDLALIRLASPIKLRKGVNPVCLPWGHEADLPLEGNNVIVTGWGATHFGDTLSPVLNEIDVTIFQTDDCVRSYSTLVDYTFDFPQSLGEESLCIGDPSDTRIQDSCEGDSGGPAVLLHTTDGLMPDYHYTMVGVVSKGFGCGKKDFPGIYVRVQYPEHLAWIKRVAFSNTYESICNPECVTGECVSVNMCQCDERWEGEQCQHAICEYGCANGECVAPGTCKCHDGWYGYQCDKAICNPPCNMGWGECVAPNTCNCTHGVQGDLCQYLICDPECVIEGFCHLCDETNCGPEVGR